MPTLPFLLFAARLLTLYATNSAVVCESPRASFGRVTQQTSKPGPAFGRSWT